MVKTMRAEGSEFQDWQFWRRKQNWGKGRGGRRRMPRASGAHPWIEASEAARHTTHTPRRTAPTHGRLASPWKGVKGPEKVSDEGFGIQRRTGNWAGASVSRRKRASCGRGTGHRSCRRPLATVTDRSRSAGPGIPQKRREARMLQTIPHLVELLLRPHKAPLPTTLVMRILTRRRAGSTRRHIAMLSASAANACRFGCPTLGGTARRHTNASGLGAMPLA
ncbi:hypothetical protein M011DRAFT_307803 [Sporormia fimetaria CBS 119925]|uniref:Uncharacterized protein n=1 Tax=Sporormia fimetaria CBS 119925 TaxID=1340428 RepID=A0A6A6VI03_9PLEO|nr:hypothetical protein M011DRAFT_307803 [Sporormia fimetaria CBS 119925]